jgi:hypothetical protein
VAIDQRRVQDLFDVQQLKRPREALLVLARQPEVDDVAMAVDQARRNDVLGTIDDAYGVAFGELSPGWLDLVDTRAFDPNVDPVVQRVASAGRAVVELLDVG